MESAAGPVTSQQRARECKHLEEIGDEVGDNTDEEVMDETFQDIENQCAEESKGNTD